MKNPGDAEAWEKAVGIVKNEYCVLSDRLRGKVRALSVMIKDQKTALHELTRSVEGEAVCEICRGECCHTGKYHFTVTDMLVYLSDGKDLFTPDFAAGRCPYLGRAGCIMEPEYRPFNCITFNCEQIECLLQGSAVREFYSRERKLRIQYAEMEKIFANTFTYGLLANFERIGGKHAGILFQ